MYWKKEQLVGFSVKSLEELKRVVNLGVNMVEVKIDGFAKNGTPLYVYCNQNFYPNKKNLALLKNALGWTTSVQFHLPIEDRLDINQERGLNPGVLAHHEILASRCRMFNSIFSQFGKNIVLTMHPPLVSVGWKDVMPRDELIENSRKYFESRDIERLKLGDGCNTIICLENMTDEKELAGNLGYLPKHFKSILLNSRTFHLTMDVGHRRLTKDFSMRKFLSVGIPIGNFHFHGNSGKFNKHDWRDDKHLLPTPENVSGKKRGYDNYIRYFKRHRVPIVLEISHLEEYTDKQLAKFLINFKKELK